MNPNFCCKSIFLFGAISILLATQAHAVDRAWTNSASGSWNDALNWDTGVPVAGDNAFINNGGTALIDASQNVVSALLVLGASNNVTAQSGNVIMSGGTLTTSSDIRIGGTSVAVPNVGTFGGTGTFTQSAGDITLTGGNLNIGFGDTAIGTYNISGGTLLVNVGGIIAVGNRGMGTVNQSGGSIYSRVSPASATISQINLGRNGAVATGASPNPGLASGTYTLSGGNATVGSLRYGNSAAGAVGSTNTFNLQGGSLVVSNIVVINPNAVNRFNFTSGSLTAAFVGMSLTNNGGILRAASLFFGSASTVSPTTAAGVITSEVGTMTFGAGLSYNQGASGTLAVDISSTGNDFYSLTGNASLLGTIVVNLLAGYDPSPGTAFNILTAGTVLNGTTVSGATPGGYAFVGSVISGATNQTLQLTVVPEPGTFALLALPGLIFFIRRAFKKS